MPIEPFVRALIRHRLAVLGTIAVITLGAVFFAAKLKFDSSIESWFLDGDPAVVSYHEFTKRFGGDEIVVTGIFAPDIFQPDVLHAVRRLTDKLAKAPHALRVRSLANGRIALGSEGFVSITDLMAEVPSSPAGVAVLRERALGNKMMRNFTDAHGKATAIILEHKPRLDFQQKIELVAAVRKAIAEESGLDIKIAGTAPLDDAFFAYNSRDMSILGPAATLLIVLIAFVVFRRFSAAAVPLTVVVLTIIWLFGLMGILGIDITLISSSLTAVILAVGVADSIHLLAAYYQFLMDGKAKEEAIVATIVELTVPCFFTSATTVAGMLSLLASSLQPMREFGWLAAMGVALAFLLTMTAVPCVLHLAKPPDAAFIARQRFGPMARLLGILAHPRRGASVAITVGNFALTALCLVGLSRLEVGANVMNYFKPGDPIRQATEAIERTLGGSATIEFLVSAPDEGLKKPENLRRLEAMQAFMEKEPGISHSLSVIDSLKDMNRVLNDGAAAAFAVPDTRELAAQLYLLMEGEADFTSAVQDNYSVGRISSRILLSEAKHLTAKIAEYEARLARDFPGPELHLDMTGFAKLMGKMEAYLVDSQIQSFLIAFTVITLMMMLLLRSVRLGLFSMIPNIMPIAIGLGFMAAAGVALDPGTAMIASIALGLVVDDTVHYMVRLRRNIDAGHELAHAIALSMEQTGRPIIVTSVVLAGGFSVLALGSFMPNIYFGMISAIVIVVALFCDLVVLPAALVTLRPKLSGKARAGGDANR